MSFVLNDMKTMQRRGRCGRRGGLGGAEAPRQRSPEPPRADSGTSPKWVRGVARRSAHPHRASAARGDGAVRSGPMMRGVAHPARSWARPEDPDASSEKGKKWCIWVHSGRGTWRCRLRCRLPAAYCPSFATSSRFRTLPVGLRGRSGTIWMSRGIFHCARPRWRQKSLQLFGLEGLAFFGNHERDDHFAAAGVFLADHRGLGDGRGGPSGPPRSRGDRPFRRRR